MATRIFILLIACGLAACQHTAREESSTNLPAQTLVGGKTPQWVAGNGPPFQGRLVHRSYHDVFKLPEGEVERRIDSGFDYAAGHAFEQVYDLQGRAVGAPVVRHVQPAASREEIDAAFAIVKADTRLVDVVNQADVQIHGGFVYFDPSDKLCGVGSRCLRVMVHRIADDSDVANSLVNLVTGTVVYPFAQPDSVQIDAQ